MSQDKSIQCPPSIGTGSKLGVVLIASGMYSPCAAETGVDIHAAAVKRMYAVV